MCCLSCRHECPVRLSSPVRGQCGENSQHALQGPRGCTQDRADAQHTRFTLHAQHLSKMVARCPHSYRISRQLSYSDISLFLFSDNSFINPQLQKIFERVRQSADFMPSWQMNVSMAILWTISTILEGKCQHKTAQKLLFQLVRRFSTAAECL